MAYLAETCCCAANDPSSSSMMILNRVIDVTRSVTWSLVYGKDVTPETGVCDQYPDIVATFFFYWSELRQTDTGSLLSVGGDAGVDE